MKLELSKNDEELKRAFYDLKSRQDIASLLEVSDKTLVFYLYRIKNNYQHFYISKKSGGKRRISAPSTNIKLLQKKLNYILQLVVPSVPSVHGFVKDKSIVTNASSHIGSTFVFNIDIKNFFPSIHLGRIKAMFKAKPFEFTDEVTTVLAQLCCDEEGILPQGAPTSPVISNMICLRLDRELQKLAGEEGCFYTRYGDDMTFSTNRNNISERIVNIGKNHRVRVGNDVEQIIDQGNWFDINHKKTRVRRQMVRQEVTGLTVNVKVNVRRVFIRQIRAMLHDWDKNGYKLAEEKYLKINNIEGNPSFGRVVRGKIAFVRQVRGDRDKIYRKYHNEYNTLVNRTFGKSLPFLPVDAVDQILAPVWVVKCGGKTGTGFFLKGVGFVTAYHTVVDHIENNVEFAEIFSSRDWLGGLSTRVKVQYYDKDKDLALIDTRVPSTIDSLELGNYKKIKTGASVTFIGFPLYRPARSPLLRPNNRVTGNVDDLWGIDSSMVYGLSGGPVIDDDDGVVGVILRGARNYKDGDEVTEHTFTLISELLEMVKEQRGPPISPNP